MCAFVGHARSESEFIGSWLGRSPKIRVLILGTQTGKAADLLDPNALKCSSAAVRF